MIDIDKEFDACEQLSDDRLLEEFKTAAADERCSEVRLLIRLSELDRRDLSTERGYSSGFDFCVRALGYARATAYKRVAVAKKARQFRSMLGMIARGELQLHGASMLAGLLTSENYRSLLNKARNKSDDEIARIVAAVQPRSAPKDTIRVISAPPDAGSTAPAPPELSASTPADSVPTDLLGEPLEPQAAQAVPELYQIAFTATKETRDLLMRAKELLRHRFPKAETGAIVKLALQKLLEEIDRDLRAPAKSRKAPRASPDSRHIPESVKQEAWERDGGQCAYVAPDGTRCTARAWIEYDHGRPFALGGSSSAPANIRAYCWPHNQWAARQVFGEGSA